MRGASCILHACPLHCQQLPRSGTYVPDRLSCLWSVRNRVRIAPDCRRGRAGHSRFVIRSARGAMVAEAEVKKELDKLLRSVDLATTSERQIRQRLAEQLGQDVSDFKELVKNEVEAYLVETAVSKRKADTPSPNPKPVKAARTEKAPAGEVAEFPKDGIDLGGKKRADVSTFKGQVYVSVREWYEKDGKLMPGAKGISLHATDQFSKIEGAVDAISDALAAEDEGYELPLSDKRKVTISKFTGKPTVNIREYYEKEGKLLPGKKGIMLSGELWGKLRSALGTLSQEAARLS